MNTTFIFILFTLLYSHLHFGGFPLVHTNVWLFGIFPLCISEFKTFNLLAFSLLRDRNKDGKPEFDFDTDAEDIRLPEIYSEEAKEKLRRDYYRHRRESHSTPEMEFSLRVSDREI